METKRKIRHSFFLFFLLVLPQIIPIKIGVENIQLVDKPIFENDGNYTFLFTTEPYRRYLWADVKYEVEDNEKNCVIYMYSTLYFELKNQLYNFFNGDHILKPVFISEDKLSKVYIKSGKNQKCVFVF